VTVLRFAGRTSMVTGGRSGVGRAIALRLAHEGAHVIGVGRSRDALRALVADEPEVPGRVEGREELDLIDDGAVGTLGSQYEWVASSPDIPVHSAGVHEARALTSMPIEARDRMYRTLVSAPLNQLLIPMLERSRGQIVFVTSNVVPKPDSDHSPSWAARS